MNPGSVVEKGRRDRLEQILDLARSYQGWSSRQMAGEMGRDPAHLVPEGGVPKMDMVVNLARVLDWEVAEVVKFLWDGEEGAGEKSEVGQLGTARAGIHDGIRPPTTVCGLDRSAVRLDI